MRLLRRLGTLAGLCCLLLTAGCVNLSELQFKADHRLTFISPEEYAEVAAPVRIEWTMDGFEVLPKGSSAAPSETAGYFAVFVDRSPIKPGETLEEVAGRDQQCRRDPKCPDAAYLEANGVYVTRATRLTVPNVPPLSSRERVQLHQVTVILLDSEGRRIGEYAWFLQFKMENRIFDL